MRDTLHAGGRRDGLLTERPALEVSEILSTNDDVGFNDGLAIGSLDDPSR